MQRAASLLSVIDPTALRGNHAFTTPEAEASRCAAEQGQTGKETLERRRFVDGKNSDLNISQSDMIVRITEVDGAAAP
jgi:hypothetical protein